ncbi:MAG: small conductance mechanosensitive channel [Thermoleophilaceae bacterium]|jgi:small conductance mechanosensitive channel|nr:small conductance mechanosensitive channel [Thermoleophilaceae bacterium]MEA2409265.1 small conductance mechanosensitive channel [Thermoleophilaceae bacterium]
MWPRQAPEPQKQVEGKRASRTMRRHAAALRGQAKAAAQQARRQLLVLVPLTVVVLVAYLLRRQLFGVDKPVRLATAGAMVLIGWALARNLGRMLQPRLAQRLDPGAAGVVGFMVRLLTLVTIVLVSLRLAGLKPGTLALGASFTAVIVGLAAQQTVGNVLAGVVLLSARPFQIGDRVRFNGYGMDVEGTVAAHGLLYLTLTDGADLVQVPNSTALAMSNRPMREPAAVDMRARLPADLDPEEIQERLTEAITVRTKGPPHVALEELDADGIVVRIRAKPADDREGGRLAGEVLSAVAALR